MIHSQALVHVHLGAIAENYRRLSRLGSKMLPVIKADAYGHGLAPVARTLLEAGADQFAVGTVDEAVALRDALAADPSHELPRFHIVSLLGPLDAAEARTCREEGILPFVFREEQLAALHEAGKAGEEPMPVALKFDTGMARLGFTEQGLPELLDRLTALPGLRPVMVASHLAASDDPSKAEFTREQNARFSRILNAVRERGHETLGCLANSAGILAWPNLHYDVQRPGLALYGLNPLIGTAWADRGSLLWPAMEITVPVIQTHELKAGQSISYGRLYTAPEDKRVAIVAAGYADFYSRSLSSADGKGPAMVLRGKRAPVLGRVCMQLTAVDVSSIPDVVPGDRAYLLGGPAPARVTADELAGWQGTISYEIVTAMGMNERRYSDDILVSY